MMKADKIEMIIVWTLLIGIPWLLVILAIKGYTGPNN